MKEKLSTESYKGVRDFYPNEQALQNYILEVMALTTESFGYEEYGASILEPLELYEAKSGEEIVREQTYSFEDRGGRNVTLRPEMTPTLARMVARKRRELTFPLRWYSIPNVFRYERPQRGRLREHWQLNVDVFGITDIKAETEVISLANEIMMNFGASKEGFEIRIGNRKLLDAKLSELQVPQEKHAHVLSLLDKKDKDEEACQELISIVGNADLDIKPDEEITSLLESLKDAGVESAHFDNSIVRGFDYYTGVVFEVFDTADGNNRSLFGGGRYDNLLEVFGEKPIPAVGFGMGDVTMRDFLETHELLPELGSATDIHLCTVDDSALPTAYTLASRLRGEGIHVSVNLTDKKVGDQVKLAHKKGIPFVICIGEKEEKAQAFTIKNLKTEEEKEVPVSEIASFIVGD
jgi:histidyl-tRNA synthetase|tara:strand:+ start:2939 stop:4162 length:1224 start_codon:yes stop_codon:yes gene_type:complete